MQFANLYLNSDYRQRVTNNAKMQKEWVKEQIREHQWQDQLNKKEGVNYADQTDTITRMRGMMEDDMTMRK